MSKKLLATFVVSLLSATALIGVSYSAQACTINGRTCLEVVEGVPVQILPSAGDYREPQSSEPRNRERPESPGDENPENYRQREHEHSEPYPTDGSSQPVFVFTDDQPNTVNPGHDNAVIVQPAPGRPYCDNACLGMPGLSNSRDIGD